MKHGLLWTIILAVLAGAVGVFAKLVLQEMSPLELSRYRFLIATASLLACFPFFTTKPDKTIPRKIWLQAICISLLGTGNVLLFAFGIQHTTAMIGQLLYVLTPIIIVFATRLIYRSPPNKKIYTGILLGLIGSVLVILLPVIQGAQPLSTGSLQGNIIITLATLSFSLYLVLSKNMYHYFSPFTYNALYIFTTTIAVSVLMFGQQDITPITQISSQTWGMLLYLGIVATTLYYLGYQYLIKHLSALHASLIQYVQPVAVIVRAIILLGEQLTPLFVIGMSLSLLGVYLVNKVHTQATK